MVYWTPVRLSGHPDMWMDLYPQQRSAETFPTGRPKVKIIFENQREHQERAVTWWITRNPPDPGRHVDFQNLFPVARSISSIWNVTVLISIFHDKSLPLNLLGAREQIITYKRPFSRFKIRNESKSLIWTCIVQENISEKNVSQFEKMKR